MDMEEDERKALVKEIHDTLKTLGREAGAPHLQGQSTAIRSLLMRIAVMFETPADRTKREQA